MRYDRFRSLPHKRHPGIHMITTEAQTLDEALAIIRRVQSRPRPRKQSLAQQFAANQNGQRLKSVTLTDRVVKLQRAPKRQNVIWSRERCVEAYATGSFKIEELAKHARVRKLQVWVWVKPQGFTPYQWRCSVCMKDTVGKPECAYCGLPWHHLIDRSQHA